MTRGTSTNQTTSVNSSNNSFTADAGTYESSPTPLSSSSPSSSSQWRQALLNSCAELLGESVDSLQAQYAEVVLNPPAAPPGLQAELEPRDVVDFAIVAALKARSSSSSATKTMRNAQSWLFNVMDRKGTNYVLREEFVRYAPFMSPVADAAVVGSVFDHLVASQVDEEEEMEEETLDNDGNIHTLENIQHNSNSFSTSLKTHPSAAALRRRSSQLPAVNRIGTRVTAASTALGTFTGSATGGTERREPQMTTQSSSSSSAPSRHRYPPQEALRYSKWAEYYTAVQEKYHCEDAEWDRVRSEVGIDENETLVKSQAAIVHAEILPALGKLFLSQRYLIFFAAVGKNHYVARLGAIENIIVSTIPILMRDCFQVMLQSDKNSALDGLTAHETAPSSDALDELEHTNQESMSNENEELEKKKKTAIGKTEPTTSEHIGNLMKQFTSGDKPLIFSLLEFRETKRRDNWVTLLREMVAAHKLHVKSCFGLKGRVSALQTNPPSVPGVSPEDPRDVNEVAVAGDDSNELKKRNEEPLNYRRSPFRNEPSTPLLVVAAHANVARYRAMRRVTSKRYAGSLLIFSHPQRHGAALRWYTDSVRQYDKWSSRSWIERLLSTIQENVATNKRMYRIHDEEPFDVGVLAGALTRCSALCAPLGSLVRNVNHLVQWRNPPATILACLCCLAVASLDLVPYVPALLVLAQAAWIVETRYNYLGLAMRMAERDARAQRQDDEDGNVLDVVAQVKDVLQVAQNAVRRLNVFLGKVQTLCFWGAEEWQSWVAVSTLIVVAFVLLVVPVKMLFMAIVFLFFVKHFLPPQNPVRNFWESVPHAMPHRRKRINHSPQHRR